MSDREQTLKKGTPKTVKRTQSKSKKKASSKESQQIRQDSDTDVDSMDSEVERRDHQKHNKPSSNQEGAKVPEHEGSSDKESEPRLPKLAKIDKNIFSNLVKVSQITAGDGKVGAVIDKIINEVCKLKALTMEATHENEFLKGRLAECRAPIKSPTYAEVTKTISEQRQEQETRAIIVTSKERRKEKILEDLKKIMDPMEMDIKDTTMRSGKEGVVIVSTDAPSLEKVEKKIQSDSGLLDLQIHHPKGRRMEMKVVGVDQEMEDEELITRIICQNNLLCKEEDTEVKAKYKGRYGKKDTGKRTKGQKGQKGKDKCHVNTVTPSLRGGAGESAARDGRRMDAVPVPGTQGAAGLAEESAGPASRTRSRVATTTTAKMATRRPGDKSGKVPGEEANLRSLARKTAEKNTAAGGPVPGGGAELPKLARKKMDVRDKEESQLTTATRKMTVPEMPKMAARSRAADGAEKTAVPVKPKVPEKSRTADGAEKTAVPVKPKVPEKNKAAVAAKKPGQEKTRRRLTEKETAVDETTVAEKTAAVNVKRGQMKKPPMKKTVGKKTTVSKEVASIDDTERTQVTQTAEAGAKGSQRGGRPAKGSNRGAARAISGPAGRTRCQLRSQKAQVEPAAAEEVVGPAAAALGPAAVSEDKYVLFLEEVPGPAALENVNTLGPVVLASPVLTIERRSSMAEPEGGSVRGVTPPGGPILPPLTMGGGRL
ncbi:hypothetical protein V5799_015119 [Amblyomma americanum]|uniref:Uncharacterized protein n=1 Tax=Amblyomma americanum TaxID=6943 RepID=A0AAQ4E125_AMBAM